MYILGFQQELAFADDQGTGDIDLVGSGSVSSQAMAMVGVNRKMAGNATVYTVHIGLEHSHVSFILIFMFVFVAMIRMIYRVLEHSHVSFLFFFYVCFVAMYA